MTDDPIAHAIDAARAAVGGAPPGGIDDQLARARAHLASIDPDEIERDEGGRFAPKGGGSSGGTGSTDSAGYDTAGPAAAKELVDDLTANVNQGEPDPRSGYSADLSTVQPGPSDIVRLKDDIDVPYNEADGRSWEGKAGDEFKIEGFTEDPNYAGGGYVTLSMDSRDVDDYIGGSSELTVNIDAESFELAQLGDDRAPAEPFTNEDAAASSAFLMDQGTEKGPAATEEQWSSTGEVRGGVDLAAPGGNTDVGFNMTRAGDDATVGLKVGGVDVANVTVPGGGTGSASDVLRAAIEKEADTVRASVNAALERTPVGIRSASVGMAGVERARIEGSLFPVTAEIAGQTEKFEWTGLEWKSDSGRDAESLQEIVDKTPGWEDADRAMDAAGDGPDYYKDL